MSLGINIPQWKGKVNTGPKRKYTKRKDTTLRYMADFETVTKGSKEYAKNGHTDVHLWYALRMDNDTHEWKHRMQDFYDWLRLTPYNKNIKFHNLSFDGNFIFKFLLKQPDMRCMNLLENQWDIEYDKKGKIKLRPGEWHMFHNDNRIYAIDIKFPYIRESREKAREAGRKHTNKFSPTIRFTCSYLLLNSPLGPLGDDMGIKKKIYKDHYEGITEIEFMNKGGFDMNEFDLQNMKDYCLSDTTIGKLSLINLQRAIETVPWATYTYTKSNKRDSGERTIDVFNELTSGGIVMKIYNNFLKDMQATNYGNYEWDEIIEGQKINREQYELAVKWKIGGFTQFNEIYRAQLNTDARTIFPLMKNGKKVKGTGIDINSSYPAQAAKLMPYGPLSSEPWPPSTKYVNLEYYEIYVNSARIKPHARDYVSLRVWNKKEQKGMRYTRACGKSVWYYTKEEFEYYQSAYDIDVEKINVYYSKGANYMKVFIDKLYQLRLDYKNGNKKKGIAKSPAIAYGIKILINAFFGKNMARAEYDSAFFVTNEEYEKMKSEHSDVIMVNGEEHHLKTFRQVEYEGHDIELLKIDQDGIIDQEEIEHNDFGGTGYRVIKTMPVIPDKEKLPNVLLGSTMTSLARVQLHTTAEKVGYSNVIYTDTDSIYSSEDEKTMRRKVNIHDTNLGAWSFDCEFDGFKTLGAKKYILSLTDHPANDEKQYKFAYSGAKPNIDKLKGNSKEQDEFWEYWQVERPIENAKLKRKDDPVGILLDETSFKAGLGNL